MEVLGDFQFRAAAASVGGFDESIHEFLRLPHGSSPSDVTGVVRRFHANELALAPGAPALVPQIMTGEASPAAAAATLLREAGAPRVDLNCGCPSRRANSDKHGGSTAAGASLLREPERLYQVVSAMAAAVGADGVSVKMRAGFSDDGLFDECVLAVIQGGASLLTVHGRTRAQGYDGDADWGLVARAVGLCAGRPILVVGNGDVTCGMDVARRLSETGCGGIMVGRGAVRNPWVFWEARRACVLDGSDEEIRDVQGIKSFLRMYYAAGTGVDVFGVEEGEVWRRVLEVVGKWGEKRHCVASGRVKMIVRYADWAKGEAWDRIRQADGTKSLIFLELVMLEMEYSLEKLKEKEFIHR